MSVYYDKGISSLFYICDNIEARLPMQDQIFFNQGLSLADGGDMDARDYVRMRYEKRLREGLEERSGESQSIGSFEKYTRVRMWPLPYSISLTIAYMNSFHNIFLLFRALAVV